MIINFGFYFIVQIWLTLFCFSAKDQTIRIWNYETAKIELVKKYQSEISALALHPTGLFVAVGFSNKLHLMEILLDTLKTVKSFDFPKCDELVFSHQGHLLACAYQSLISIFSVFSFSILGTLKVREFGTLDICRLFENSII